MADGYVLGPDEARRRLGPFRVLVDGAEQDQQLALYTGVLPRGGPPLHSHAFDEGVLVLEGRLLVELEDVVHEVAAGGFAWFPAGARHVFANPDDTPVTALGIARPDGILPLFAERGDYLAGLGDGAVPDPERMAAIYAAHASEVHGPPLLDRPGG
ncbi:cupin domain-containing protein [Salsipaludibacter albus]|uniref:cupin domain-containing protein n=1 Tax=Salsipaludibacter albus TaxID=2849650 RepID=UPI001EE415A7|nr:cupin domain-containing protein [Salsipaludibacter albus]MBY5164485.1 cupin domain-containing protein [Salsipaludibacter albus]